MPGRAGGRARRAPDHRRLPAVTLPRRRAWRRSRPGSGGSATSEATLDTRDAEAARRRKRRSGIAATRTAVWPWSIKAWRKVPAAGGLLASGIGNSNPGKRGDLVKARFFVCSAGLFLALVGVALAGAPPETAAPASCHGRSRPAAAASCHGTAPAQQSGGCHGRSTFASRRAARVEARVDARADRACARANARAARASCHGQAVAACACGCDSCRAGDCGGCSE